MLQVERQLGRFWQIRRLVRFSMHAIHCSITLVRGQSSIKGMHKLFPSFLRDLHSTLELRGSHIVLCSCPVRKGWLTARTFATQYEAGDCASHRRRPLSVLDYAATTLCLSTANLEATFQSARIRHQMLRSISYPLNLTNIGTAALSKGMNRDCINVI